MSSEKFSATIPSLAIQHRSGAIVTVQPNFRVHFDFYVIWDSMLWEKDVTYIVISMTMNHETSRITFLREDSGISATLNLGVFVECVARGTAKVEAEPLSLDDP